tara:strand:+ start:10015 stop:11691 length:1677 start_codon:yes stop_codon:yes gene_type:complete
MKKSPDSPNVDRDIVDTADRGLAGIKAERDQKLSKNKAYMAASTTPISYTEIYKALDEIDQPGKGGLYKATNGSIIDPQAEAMSISLRNKIDEWYKNPNSTHTPIEFDELKRAIGNIETPRGSSASVAAKSKIYNSVKDSIKTQVPEYEKYMGDFGEASELIKDMRDTLSLGNSNAYSAGITKLSRAFKGGKGNELFEELAKSEPTLPAMIAGRHMQKILPQGIGMYMSPFTAFGAGALGFSALAHPGAAAGAIHGLAMTSPRYIGASSLIGGKASKLATKWSPEAQAGVNAMRQVEIANQVRPISLEEMNQPAGPFPVQSRTPFLPIEKNKASSTAPEGEYESIDKPMSLEEMNKSFEQSVPETIESLSAKIKKPESGSYEGNYGAMGIVIPKSGDRAYGAYQIMGNNIPSWTKEVLGRAMNPQEFLASKEAQDRVARAKIEQYYRQYGNAADVASMWHSGRPLSVAKAANAGDPLGTKTEDYARRIASDPYGQRATGGRIQRASGGRTGQNHEQLVNRLMTMAKQAKKATDESTEPLLNAPDEAIVKALDVAQQAI